MATSVMKGKYPTFDALLQSIHQRLDGKCVDLEISRNIEEAQQRLTDIKTEFYQSSLISTAVNDILTKQSGDSALASELLFENENNSNKDGIYHVVHSLMQSVEAQHCLSMTLDNGAANPEERNIFGLTRSDFIIPTPKKKLLHQSIQQILVPQIESYFKALTLELFRFVNPTNDDSEGLALAKAHKLPTYIANETEKSTDTETTLQREQDDFEAKYQNSLKQISHILNELEEDYLGSDKKETLQTSKVNIDWLNAKCTYMLEKVNMMRNKVHLQTYTKDNIAALKKIHDSLTKRIKETKKEIQKVKHSLEVYESIGEGFTKLLTEYTQLTNDIDLKKWALAELKSGKGIK